MIRVTIFNEYLHEKEIPAIASVYPEGIHGAIGSFLKKESDICVRYATLDMPECGLGRDVLEDTDVLIWWAHAAHHMVPDAVAKAVADRVLAGMGFIGLHSAHMCKPLRLLLGTTMTLSWKEEDSEVLFTTCPTHPIAAGVPERFAIPQEEMYGEYFDIPKPDDVIFTGWFRGGYVFRSGVTFTRGNGKIFYFQPGHEAYPVYFQEEIQRIITNAVRWAAPVGNIVAPRDNIEVKG